MPKMTSPPNWQQTIFVALGLLCLSSGDSQDEGIDVDVGIDVEIAAESANSESFSASAANFAELPQSCDRVEESTHNHGDFSPTTR